MPIPALGSFARAVLPWGTGWRRPAPGSRGGQPRRTAAPGVYTGRRAGRLHRAAAAKIARLIPYIRFYPSRGRTGAAGATSGAERRRTAARRLTGAAATSISSTGYGQWAANRALAKHLNALGLTLPDSRIWCRTRRSDVPRRPVPLYMNFEIGMH